MHASTFGPRVLRRGLLRQGKKVANTPWCSPGRDARATLGPCSLGLLGSSARAFHSSSAASSVLGDCMSGYSIEVTPNAARKIKSFADIELLAPGTTVNVTYLVGDDIDESLQICKRLVEGGMRPVAHVPARAFTTIDDAEDYLSRLTKLGVEDVLVLGGGAPLPAGELHETMQILESGLLQSYGFKTVGVAAHPEGHPDIGENELLDALLRKAEWARNHGIDLYYETQFCFEPGPIIEWEKRTRQALQEHLRKTSTSGDEDGGHGTEWLPSVRLGVAGPAKISSLIKFGAMSGVGNSLNFVSKYAGNVFKLATKMGPEELILGVGEHQRNDPGSMIEGFHFYPFGGFKATLKWIHEQ
jgi:methylenetetrahydrofolate reductase (NADPH)